MDKSTKMLVRGVGAVAAGALVVGLGVYLKTGRRGKNSPYIPDAIEERIDSVVAWLDTQLGTIGFLDIVDGRPSASIWQITDAGIAPFDWGRWRRPW